MSKEIDLKLLFTAFQIEIFPVSPDFSQYIASGGQNPFEKGFWTPKTFVERYAFLHKKRPL